MDEKLVELFEEKSNLVHGLRAWKDKFANVLENTLRSGNGDNYQIANWAYWEGLEKKQINLSTAGLVRDIYKTVCGQRFVPQKKAGQLCPVCNEEVFIKSAEQLKRIENGGWSGTIPEETMIAEACCEACKNLHNEVNRNPANVIVFPNHNIHDLIAMNYKEYLQTEYWKVVREHILDRDDRTCKLCGATKWSGHPNKTTFHVHHNSYQHRGYEFQSDLITLCKSCHQKFHDKVRS